jgi:hypothetical protein
VEAVRQIPPPGPRHLPYFAPSIYVAPCGDHVYIHCDEGRLVRPMLTVPQACDGRRWAVSGVLANTSVEQLLNAGALRYVDAAEISTLNVALFPDRAPPSARGAGARARRSRPRKGPARGPRAPALFFVSTETPNKEGRYITGAYPSLEKRPKLE